MNEKELELLEKERKELELKKHKLLEKQYKNGFISEYQYIKETKQNYLVIDKLIENYKKRKIILTFELIFTTILFLTTFISVILIYVVDGKNYHDLWFNFPNELTIVMKIFSIFELIFALFLIILSSFLIKFSLDKGFPITMVIFSIILIIILFAKTILIFAVIHCVKNDTNKLLITLPNIFLWIIVTYLIVLLIIFIRLEKRKYKKIKKI